MDSGQADDDWVVLDSWTADDDEEAAALALALSSACATPCSDHHEALVLALFDEEDDDDAADISSLLADAAKADHDAESDAEAVYMLSDAEDDDAEGDADAEDHYYFSSESEGVYVHSDDADDDDDSEPLHRPLSGLFYRTLDGSVGYAPFDPRPRHGEKRHNLIPDPTFSALIHEGVTALASTRGLVCLRGEDSCDYYIANPATFKQARLPTPNCDHFAQGKPAIVITFELGDDHHHDGKEDTRCFYRHYHVVVAYLTEEDGYNFEWYSSRTSRWTTGDGGGIPQVDAVIPESGVGALGSAFWRATNATTAEDYILRFDPVSGCAYLVTAPEEVTRWTHWELCEMEGELCAACMNDPVTDVPVIALALDLARRDTHDGGCVAERTLCYVCEGDLIGRQGVTPLRSQDKAEVVVLYRENEGRMVVAMNFDGRTTRTIRISPDTGYYADFIPYAISSAAVSPSGTPTD